MSTSSSSPIGAVSAAGLAPTSNEEESLLVEVFTDEKNDVYDRLWQDDFIDRIRAAIPKIDQQALIHNNMSLHHNLAVSPHGKLRALAPLCYQHGADIHEKTQKTSATALHAAVLRNDADLVAALIQAGADVDHSESSIGWPMELALKQGHVACALVLLREGAYCSDSQARKLFMELLDRAHWWESTDIGLMTWLRKTTITDKPDTEAMRKMVEMCLHYYASHPDDEALKEAFYEEILVLCLKNGAELQPSSYIERQGLTTLTQRLHKRKFAGADDRLLVETLLKSPEFARLPLMLDGQAPQRLLLDTETAPDWVCQAVKEHYKPEALDAYEKAKPLIHQISLWADWGSASTQTLSNFLDALKLEELVHEMEKYGHPAVELIKQDGNSVAPMLEALKKFREALAEITSNPQGAFLEDNLANCNRDCVYYMLISRGHFDTLARSFTADWDKHYEDKIQYHLLFDKALVPEPGDRDYQGMKQLYPATALALAVEAYTRTAAFSKLPATTQKNLTALVGEFKRAASLFIPRETLRPTEYMELCLGHISSLKVGERLHIPLSSARHAMLPCIERSSDGTFTVSLYNTGQGVSQNHPQWKKSNKYQTYLSITGVPRDVILKTELLQTLLEEQPKKSDLDPTYDFLKELEKRGGKREAASVHEEDYEQKQLSGTCSAQCYMAALRRQVMSSVSDPAVGLSLYKQVKAGVLLPWGKAQLSSVDQTIYDHSLPKLKKLELDLQVAASASDLVEANKMGSALVAALDDPFAGLDRLQDLSSLQRHSLLRAASKRLAEQWANSAPDSSCRENPYLSYAVAIWECQQQAVRNFHSEVERLVEAKEYKKLGCYIARVFVASQRPDLAIEAAVKHLDIDSAEAEERDEVKDALRKLLIQTRWYCGKDYEAVLIEAFLTGDTGPLTKTTIDEISKEDAESAVATFD